MNPSGKNCNGIPAKDRDSTFRNRGMKGWYPNWRFHSSRLTNGFRIVSHKFCRGCNRLLTWDKFYECRTRDSYQSRCSKCMRADSKRRMAKYKTTPYYNSPQRLRDVSSRSYLHRYGITIDQRDAMVAEGCAICGVKPGSLVIDHDHYTGKVRGVLCQKHNSGLGFFQDNPTVLVQASQYVLRGIRCEGILKATVSTEESLAGVARYIL